MTTKYYYELDDGGVELLVIDELGPINTWKDTTQPNDCLIIPGGIVSLRNDSKILHSGPPDNAPVVTLHGATWDSSVGDSGSVEGHLIDRCSPTQWTLTKKE